MDRTGDYPPQNSDRNGPNYAVAGFGLGVLGVFAVLYSFRIDLYPSIIDLWAFKPFRYPFLDLIFVGAQVECFQKGIDVYIINPCDPLGRLHDYSPLWLRMPFLAAIKTWPIAIGLSMDVLFMLSLLALPIARKAIDTTALMFCVISPMSVFALERGNADVEMFMLAAVAAVCLDRAAPTRLCGYAIILLGSLLKFYPLVLFALLIREKLRAAAAIGLLAICAMAALVWTYNSELRPMVSNIDHPSTFTDSFGAGQLPEGVALLRWKSAGAPSTPDSERLYVRVFIAVYAILAGAVCATVFHLHRSASVRQALRALNPREELCLAMGALLVVGCFFAGRSVGYRSIDLLLVIPSLLALARVAPPRVRVFRIASVISVFLLWYLVPQRLVYGMFGGMPGQGGGLPTLLFWLSRELAWWWLIAILASLILAIGLNNLENQRTGRLVVTNVAARSNRR